jgi:hypothetical protein
MSAVCVITPIVIAAWPAIAAAVTSVAASMGFSIVAQTEAQTRQTSRKKSQRSVEAEVPNSEVVAEGLSQDQTMVIERQGLRIEFGRNANGACTVCASGEAHTDNELRKIAQEVAGRVVQQFAYHKLMTELKNRNYQIVQEQVLEDQSIRVRVREV